MHDNRGKYITVAMARNALIQDYGPGFGVSWETVQFAMKEQLSMRYKRIEKVIPKSATSESKRSFMESLAMQLEIERLGIETIFVDEFTISSRNNNHYGWTYKGQKGFVASMDDKFTMSFIAAFSARWFYGIQGVTMTTDSSMFIKFLRSFVTTRRSLYEADQTPPAVLIMDNASIHKSSLVKNAVEKLQLSLLTITPYSPALNPCEKLILVLKTTLKAKKAQGKIICLKTIASIAKEIKINQLEGFIKASRQEWLDKINSF